MYVYMYACLWNVANCMKAIVSQTMSINKKVLCNIFLALHVALYVNRCKENNWAFTLLVLVVKDFDVHQLIWLVEQ